MSVRINHSVKSAIKILNTLAIYCKTIDGSARSAAASPKFCLTHRRIRAEASFYIDSQKVDNKLIVYSNCSYYSQIAFINSYYK